MPVYLEELGLPAGPAQEADEPAAALSHVIWWHYLAAVAMRAEGAFIGTPGVVTEYRPCKLFLNDGTQTQGVGRVSQFVKPFSAVPAHLRFHTMSVVPEPGQPQDVPTAVWPNEGPVLSVSEMAQALDRVSRPDEQEEPPLPFDPDDYPLF